MHSMTSQFWKIWLRDYFPTLIIRQKWHVRQRNLRVDDVCLLKDQDCFRGEWRLSRVVDVFPDRFGNVRNVEVMVKPTQDGCPRYHPSGGQKLRRHVSNLVVLVPAEDQVTEDTPVRGLDVGELHQAEDNASGVSRSSGGTVSLRKQAVSCK